MTINLTAFSGSEAVGTTEHSLTTDSSSIAEDTTSGVFQAFLDLANVAAGDTFRFRVYEKVIAGGAQRVIYTSEFSGAQVTPVAACPPLFLGIGWDMSLEKIAGTDRTISWRIASSG